MQSYVSGMLESLSFYLLEEKRRIENRTANWNFRVLDEAGGATKWLAYISLDI